MQPSGPRPGVKRRSAALEWPWGGARASLSYLKWCQTPFSPLPVREHDSRKRCLTPFDAASARMRVPTSGTHAGPGPAPREGTGHGCCAGGAPSTARRIPGSRRVAATARPRALALIAAFPRGAKKTPSRWSGRGNRRSAYGVVTMSSAEVRARAERSEESAPCAGAPAHGEQRPKSLSAPVTASHETWNGCMQAGTGSQESRSGSLLIRIWNPRS